MISIENIKAILSNVAIKDKSGSEVDEAIFNVLSNLPDVYKIEYNDELECYTFKLSRKVYRVDLTFRGDLMIDQVSELDLKIKKLKDLENEIKEFCEENDETLNIELFDQDIVWGGGSWQSSSYDC